MNDARVDHIEEALTQLNGKADGLSKQMVTHQDLKAGFAKAFEQTQGGFHDQRAYTEFVVERSTRMLREEMNARFDQVDARFSRIDRRFDGMEERFDRLERLIKVRSKPQSKQPRRPR